MQHAQVVCDITTSALPGDACVHRNPMSGFGSSPRIHITNECRYYRKRMRDVDANVFAGDEPVCKNCLNRLDGWSELDRSQSCPEHPESASEVRYVMYTQTDGSHQTATWMTCTMCEWESKDDMTARNEQTEKVLATTNSNDQE